VTRPPLGCVSTGVRRSRSPTTGNLCLEAEKRPHEGETVEPTNHQLYSTTYVEDSDMISVAKSKKKIFVGTNLCNNENRTDVILCVLIGSILLKTKEPRDNI
jgi:hypothetical protein